MENPKTIQNDIQADYRTAQEQTKRFFEVYIAEKGCDATYKELIAALLHTKQREDAEFVCELLKTPTSSKTLQELEGN